MITLLVLENLKRELKGCWENIGKGKMIMAQRSLPPQPPLLCWLPNLRIMFWPRKCLGKWSREMNAANEQCAGVQGGVEGPVSATFQGELTQACCHSGQHATSWLWLKMTPALSLGYFVTQRLKPAQLLHCRAPLFTAAVWNLEAALVCPSPFPSFPHLSIINYIDSVS